MWLRRGRIGGLALVGGFEGGVGWCVDGVGKKNEFGEREKQSHVSGPDACCVSVSSAPRTSQEVCAR